MFSIVQLHWGDLPYYRESRPIVAAYADRHGYQYIEHTPPPEAVDPIERLYHRIPPVIDRLAAGDDVLYLDADAYPVNLDQRLEDFMPAYFGDERTAILFPENGIHSTLRFPGGGVNTGVFLVRDMVKVDGVDVPMGRQILHAWFDSYAPARDALAPGATDMQRYQALNDQELFNRVIRRRFVDHINIARNPEFGGRDGDFIKHWLLMSGEERLARMKEDRLRILGDG